MRLPLVMKFALCIGHYIRVYNVRYIEITSNKNKYTYYIYYFIFHIAFINMWLEVQWK